MANKRNSDRLGANWRQRLLLVVFFLSGFASLTYQVAWQRVLNQAIGVDAHSVTLIVSIFMLGLGLGGLLGARALRWKINLIGLYASIEFALACFGAFSIDLVRSLNVWIEPHSPSLAVEFLANFLLLGPATMLMGMTLPLMVHFVRKLYLPGEALGIMYSANILGAAGGTLLAGFFLVGTVGLTDTCRIIAAVNLAIAAVVYSLKSGFGAETPRSIATSPGHHWGWRLVILLTASFVAGFVALGYEIVFFRIFTAYFGMVSYVFPLLIFSYLICMTWGNNGYGKKVEKLPVGPLAARAALLTCVTTLLILFAPEALYNLGINQEHFELERFSGAPLSLKSVEYTLVSLLTPQAMETLGITWQGLGLADMSAGNTLVQMVLVVCLSLVLMLPVRFVSGLFPMMVKLGTKDREFVGNSTGKLYFIQTLGNTAGVLVTGLALLPSFGTVATLRILGMLLAAVAASLFILERHGREPMQWKPVLAVLGAAAVVSLYPVKFYDSVRDYYDAYRFGATEPLTPAFIRENEVTVTFAYPIPNGYWLNTGRERSTSLVSNADAWEVWPLEFVAPLVKEAKRALIIGIGPGTHLPVLERLFPGIQIDVVELNPAIIQLMTELAEPSIRNSIARQNVYLTDGRRFVLRNPSLRYDIIQVGVNHATSSGAGNLFTEEFARTLRGMLMPDGVLTLNAYAPAVKGILNVFESVAVISPGKNSDAGKIAASLNAEGSGARVSHVIAWNHGDDGSFRTAILTGGPTYPSVIPVNVNHQKINSRPNWKSGCIMFPEAIRPLVVPVGRAIDDLPSTEYFLSQRQTIEGVDTTFEGRYWGSPTGCMPLADLLLR